MKKIRMTQKEVKEGSDKVQVLGYCELYEVLHTIEPIGYTCGVYGWNADVYDLGDNITVVTGYRPFGKDYIGREKRNELSNKLESIKEYPRTSDNRQKMLEDLLQELKELIREGTK